MDWNFDDLPRGRPGTSPEVGEAPRELWMAPDVLQKNPFWRYAPGKVILGHSNNNWTGIADNRHLLTIAGSRAGKGVSAILPNCLLYESSILILDPKGENATLSATRRGQGEGVAAGGLGQDVYVLDPFRVADVPDHYRGSFNPLAQLDLDSITFVDDCDSIADALVVPVPGGEAEHWDNSARLYLRGLVAWVATAPDIEHRDLNKVKDLTVLPPAGPDGFKELLIKMSTQPEIGKGLPAEAANTLLGMGENERGSVLSTVTKNLGFLSSTAMQEILSGTTRTPDLYNWKMGNSTVYLCLPASRLHRHVQFMRLFINCLISAIELNKEQPKIPALMILDEMSVLGRMAALETAAAYLAGFGCLVWSIFQDIGQIQATYESKWETFLGNASIFQTFGLNDKSSLEYVSERLGTSSIMSISNSEIGQDQVAVGYTGQSKTIQETALLSPSEVAYYFSRQSNNQLIMYPGAAPLFLNRLAYHQPEFADYRRTT